MEKRNEKNQGDQKDKREQNHYNHRTIESRWEERWKKEGIYRAVDYSKKPKKYTLFEFPYPSGERLHIGHAFAFIGTDVLARFNRMKGFNVLNPMGWDAFGLPAENYAIKIGVSPVITTEKNIANSKLQAKRWGLSVDWDREIATTDPKYYHWTQWIFLQWYKKGLAYKKEMPINWCPSCKIGLANEEVLQSRTGGKCERCGVEVSRRNIKQWIVKITQYADRLIDGLKDTGFIEKVKAAQINWIGRSEGAEIEFTLKLEVGSEKLDSEIGSGKKESHLSPQFPASHFQPLTSIKVFTTRPDTLYGATFMVISPEHNIVASLLNSKFKIQNSKLNEIRDYVEKAKKKSDLERTELNKEKTGVFSGLYAINSVTNKEIPIWISDFVLPSYGTGAIMSVPAHDQRDFEFAKKYSLPIIPVIVPEGEGEKWEMSREVRVKSGEWNFEKEPYLEVEKGITVNSPQWNGIKPSEAIKKAISWIEINGIGKRSVSYHLRDWIFSRQHYWGEPIPVVFCANCAKKTEVSSIKYQVSSIEGIDYSIVPVPECDLPIELPKVEKYQPTDTGESPLSAVSEWVNTTCPECGGPAKRETDTMPNWAGSDWYYLAYPLKGKLEVKSEKLKVKSLQGNVFLDNLDLLKYWLPVDVYIGGDEHNTLHLLYSRFTYQFLWDIGVMPKEIPEPYFKRISHGVILGSDGQRMSKSRGNVINPDEIVEAFGADCLRMYLMFMGPFDYTLSWNQESLEGCHRFLKRVYNLVQSSKFSPPLAGSRPKAGKVQSYEGKIENKNLLRKLNQTIKKVGEDIENLKFNTAIAAMMELLNEVISNKQLAISKSTLEKFLLILAPFAPHLTEELWEKLGNKFSIHQQVWPEYNPELIKEEVCVIVIQVNGKLRGTMEVEGEKWEVRELVEEMAKKNEKIKKYLEGKEIKKTIYIPGKILNFVV